MKRPLKYQILAIALLLLAVLVLPLPKRVDNILSGISTDAEQISHPVEICVDGWYLRYLVRQDVFHGELRAYSPDAQYMMVYDQDAPVLRVHNADQTILCILGCGYDSERNEMRIAPFRFTEDFSYAVMDDENERYLVSSDDSCTPDTIEKLFPDYLS